MLSDHDVKAIIERVKGRVAVATTEGRAGPTLAASDELAAYEAQLGEGIYGTIDSAVAAARRAFTRYRDMGLDGRRTIVDAMRQAMLREGQRLAYMACEETGLGRADDKVIKNRIVTIGTPGPEDLDPHAVTGDDGMM
ncbi:MAG: aldehyde dehydrogenase family protein, partial [Nitrospirota bacterium]|nr:aldehyde dehydrogenase family protein [Nitrospirota bacterium]